MIELKAVANAEELVKKTLSNKAAEIETLQGLLEKDAVEIVKGKEAMDEATNSGDIKAYQKAKAARQNAADAKEMHEARLEILQRKALISKADYEETVASIYTEVTALEDEVKHKLAELSNKMNKEAIKLEEATKRANVVLNHLQADVYRNQDRSRGKDGSILTLPTETKAIDKWSTIHWGQRGVSAQQYKEYTGNKA